MSTNLQQIGTPLLDMDGIATQLHIKGPLVGITADSQEQFSPFVTLKDIEEAGGSDTLITTIGTGPDGEPISLNRFALAYFTDDMEEEDIDRNKVENSHLLEGHEWSDFYLANRGSEAEIHTTTIVNKFNDQIKDLRAQVIQIMGYLAKNNIVDHYRPMEGFYDTFRDSYPLHQTGCLGTAYQDSAPVDAFKAITLYTGEVSNFNVGDWIIVTRGTNLNDASRRTLVKVESIVGNKVIFDRYVSMQITKDNTHLYKSLGVSHKHSFLFGHFSQQVASSNMIYTGVDDDNYRKRRKINVAHTGYATTFRINPNRANGLYEYYLDTIEICVKKTGNPGALMCYIINAAHIDNFEDPEQAADEGILLAKSAPLIVDNNVGEQICKFEFRGDDDQYPLLDNIDQGIDGDSGRTRFCMIIEALYADSTNYYELLFLQHYDAATNTLSDLQLNNIVYKYQEQPSDELMLADNFKTLTTNIDINSADLFYGVTIRPVEYSTFNTHPEGLYTADFKTYEPIQVNTARLTLRIAREGYFTVSTTSAPSTGNVRNGGTVQYIEDKTYRTADEILSTFSPMVITNDNDETGTRKLIIGNNIVEISDISGNNITIQNGAHILPGDPVYPMGYIVYLLCSREYWDSTLQQWRTEGTPVRVKLDIVSVQPAYNEAEKVGIVENINNSTVDDAIKTRLREKERISDNLIFEADLHSTRYFNKFQLQIYWRSMAGTSNPPKSYAGRIYDLSVSLDRHIT